jgi:hypothetical protein
MKKKRISPEQIHRKGMGKRFVLLDILNEK